MACGSDDPNDAGNTTGAPEKESHPLYSAGLAFTATATITRPSIDRRSAVTCHF